MEGNCSCLFLKCQAQFPLGDFHHWIEPFPFLPHGQIPLFWQISLLVRVSTWRTPIIKKSLSLICCCNLMSMINSKTYELDTRTKDHWSSQTQCASSKDSFAKSRYLRIFFSSPWLHKYHRLCTANSWLSTRRCFKWFWDSFPWWLLKFLWHKVDSRHFCSYVHQASISWELSRNFISRLRYSQYRPPRAALFIFVKCVSGGSGYRFLVLNLHIFWALY